MNNGIKTYVLMKLPPQTEPVYFICEHAIYEHAKDWSPEERTERVRRYLEENTCPSNFIRLPVLLKGDSDPHGLFQFCGETLARADDQESETFSPDYDWEEIFPELRKEPHTLDVEYKESFPILFLEG